MATKGSAGSGARYSVPGNLAALRRTMSKGANWASSPASSARCSPTTELSANGTFNVTCGPSPRAPLRSEEHTSELQSHVKLVCRLLLEKKKKKKKYHFLYNNKTKKKKTKI